MTTRKEQVFNMKARLVSFAAACFLAGGAWAHGEKPHAAPKVDYSKAEEMPFGRAADPKKAKRTIRVNMSDDMRFTPAALAVKQGDVVRFVVANKGKVMHEMVLGTMDDLKKHAEMMRKHPEMEHDEPHMAHVAPAKTGEFYYGCLIPGHFEAGMIGKVVVTKGDSK